MEYSKYLKSEHWLTLRGIILRLYGNHCALCRGESSLEVHHNTYERIGKELFDDLVVLCRDCHQRHHDTLPEFSGGGDRESIEVTFESGGAGKWVSFLHYLGQDPSCPESLYVALHVADFSSMGLHFIRIVLDSENEWWADAIANNQAMIEEKLSKYFGTDLKLVIGSLD